MSKDPRIVVHPTPPGARGTYPAANWIAKPTTVTLLDEYPGRTVDVLDVRLSDGSINSVYGFNVERTLALGR